MSEIFQPYRVSIRFRAKLMGGIPKNAEIIEGWLRTSTFVGDEDELRYQMERTLRELGADLSEHPTYDEMVEASKGLAVQRQTNGFKCGTQGLYLEGRNVKAMLKEVTNILYGKERWGPTRKGAKSYLAERVFVREDELWLGRQKPDGVETFIGHVSGPKGPQSTLTYYEYCEQPELSFTVLSTYDCIAQQQWGDILLHAQENGLGALRSQQHGRFDVLDIRPAAPDGPPDWLKRFLGAA